VKGWLLDTNVVAELARPGAARRVARWSRALPRHVVFLSVLTLGEYEKAVARLAPGDRRRPDVEAALRALEDEFVGRLLPVSDAVVRRWGRMSGVVKAQTGQSPPVIDTLLAATAVEAGLYLATRNVRDVRHTGATVFNPWDDDPAAFPVE
jgi:toxin FitB